MALLVAACSGGTDATTTTTTTTTTAAATATTTTTAGAGVSLEGLVAEAVADEAIPGMGAVLFTSSEILEQTVAGVRQNGGSDAITADDRFHIGSNTKAITAALVGRLVEQGVIEFETTLGEVFTDMSDMDPEYQEVTIRQLLSHTAGINDGIVLESDQPIDFDTGSASEQRADVAVWLLAQAPHQTPGSEMMYSNVGYAVVGVVLEKVSDRTFAELLDSEVFAPLGITTCALGTPTDPAGQPLGHDSQNQPVQLADVVDPLVFGPAGAVTYCTMGDWVRFLQETMNAHNGDSDWLTAETSAELVTPVRDDYALGWGVLTLAEQTSFTHDGSNTLNYSSAWITPGADLGWIVVTNANQASGGMATGLVSYQLNSEYLGR
jgi:CubicO group peptidase (beta-lactamase class C family)